MSDLNEQIRNAAILDRVRIGLSAVPNQLPLAKSDYAQLKAILDAYANLKGDLASSKADAQLGLRLTENNLSDTILEQLINRPDKYSVTYTTLRSLRSSGGLVPGAIYEVLDFPLGTESYKAVVKALNESELDPVVSVMETSLNTGVFRYTKKYIIGKSSTQIIPVDTNQELTREISKGTFVKSVSLVDNNLVAEINFDDLTGLSWNTYLEQSIIVTGFEEPFKFIHVPFECINLKAPSSINLRSKSSHEIEVRISGSPYLDISFDQENVQVYSSLTKTGDNTAVLKIAKVLDTYQNQEVQMTITESRDTIMTNASSFSSWSSAPRAKSQTITLLL